MRGTHTHISHSATLYPGPPVLPWYQAHSFRFLMLLKWSGRCGFSSPVSSCQLEEQLLLSSPSHTPPAFFLRIRRGGKHIRDTGMISCLSSHSPVTQAISQEAGNPPPVPSSASKPGPPQMIPSQSIQWVFEDADSVWTTQISPYALAAEQGTTIQGSAEPCCLYMTSPNTFSYLWA